MSASTVSQPLKKKYKTLLQMERERETQVAAAAAAAAAAEAATSSPSATSASTSEDQAVIKNEDNEQSAALDENDKGNNNNNGTEEGGVKRTSSRKFGTPKISEQSNGDSKDVTDATATEDDNSIATRIRSMRRTSKCAKAKNYYAQMDRGDINEDEEDKVLQQDEFQLQLASKRLPLAQQPQQQQQKQKSKSTGVKQPDIDIDAELEEYDDDLDDLDSDEVDEFCSLNADFHDQKQRDSKQNGVDGNTTPATPNGTGLTLSRKDEQNCFLNPTLAAFNYGNLFYCNFCGFSANNTNKILHHLFLHVFKCNSCNHFTYTKYDLMKHIYKHHRPNKELQIKRLVLEVTSNDWYFLCSENEPHNLTQAALVDGDYENHGEMNGDQNDGQIYRSIDTSENYIQNSKTHSRLTYSPNEQHQQQQQQNSGSAANKQQNRQKQTTNYFQQNKSQKSPEKLTQIQPKQSSVQTLTKRDLQPSPANPLKLQATPTQIGTPKITQILSTTTNTATPVASGTVQPQKLASFIESTTPNAQLLLGTDSVSGAVSTGTKPHARKSTFGAQAISQAAKAKKLNRKNTETEGEFSTETKKDLEAIKNKYMNLTCTFTCNQCNYETDDSVVAYTHLIRANPSHSIKCVACESYENDNVCSFKMHLLSKHKFYASADKLLHEFFTIVNRMDNQRIILEASLSGLVALAIANQSVSDSEHQQLQKLTESSEKSANLKRALIDANILPNVDNTDQLSGSKKARLSDSMDTIQMIQRTSTNMVTYDTEVLDDGSTIYICSKCKLVFMQTTTLFEHKCFQSLNDSANDSALQLNTSDSAAASALSDQNNLIENLKKEINNLDSHSSVANVASASALDAIEDYDNVKNSSGVIYME